MADKALPLVVLTGPTAVGKTEISIRLAKNISGEIISADSMQVYKGMDIGTAKIKPEFMQGVRHYLIDVLSPDEDFNVVKFKNMALEAMSEIYDNGHIPIITGGTGFYIQALLYDIDFKENDDDMAYRKSLEDLADRKGNEYLYSMLLQIDPESSEKIHPNNRKRIIRALEFYNQTGMKISEHNKEESQKSSPYNFAYFVIDDERDIIYEKIDRRVDRMIEDGLIDEVKKLKALGYTKDMVSMQGLGYKEILDYLNGDISFSDAVYILKRDTRHFAKRQITWFKRERDVIRVDRAILDTDEKMLKYMTDILSERGII